jgi:hypothetical protein
MAAQLYLFKNAPMQTTAAPVKVTTGTAIKTMLQVLHPSNSLRVVEWGVSFDGVAAAVPVECELISTGTIAATVTAFAAVDITQYSDPTANAPGVTLSTTGSGYTATAEGTITSVRTGDLQQVSSTTGYVKQFPLGREFEVQATHCLRVRLTNVTSTAVFAYVYAICEI